MDWESRKKEESIENFYLELPEEKIYFPIDFLWKPDEISSFSLGDKWSVDLEEGKVKTINVSEIKLKKNRIHGR